MISPDVKSRKIIKEKEDFNLIKITVSTGIEAGKPAHTNGS